MAVLSAFKRRPKAMQSILFTSTFIVAICILMVVATTEYIASKRVENVIFESVQVRARETTGLIAVQMAASVNFNNRYEIAQMMDAVLAESGGDAVGGLVINRKEQRLYETDEATIDGAVALELATQVFETGEIAASVDGMMQAVPVRFGLAVGPEMGIVGVAITQWSSARQHAQSQAQRLASLKWSGLVFLAALVAAALAMRAYLSNPIERVGAAMGRVAKENFDCEIPGVGRRDEIGGIARRLLDFRDSLAEAKREARDSAFRGAGFRGASAPIMLIGTDFEVLFVNRSCLRLLEGLTGDIQTGWPEFSANQLVGRNFADFEGAQALIATATDESVEWPLVSQLKWGETDLQLSFDQVTDREGMHIGFVVEWADVTEQKRNAAILASIDNNQLRLDFGDDWRVVSCNQNFTELTGAHEFLGQPVCNIFGPADENDVDISECQATLSGGGSVFGRFKLHIDGAEDLLVEGGFSPIFDQKGKLARAVFLGMDVTRAHLDLMDHQKQRAATEMAQKRVVDALEAGLTDLANGNLTTNIPQEFPAEYEKLRRDFNQAVAALGDAMGTVVENAGSIRLESIEITGAADDLAIRTEKQAATLEETAAALEQLTSSVLSATESADQVSVMAMDAQKNAEIGGEVSLQANAAMDEIRKSSQEISKITNVIDEIAFQTNLLALNAGVEAARAGDAGRGFAVVATEVRSLAQRSSDAASEINALITASGRQVKTGVELVNQTGSALGEIVNSVASISTRVTEIAVSSREQSVALGEINTAVNDLDQVTQQNAAMFEQTTAASHSLNSEADALVRAAERFQITKAAPEMTKEILKGAKDAPLRRAEKTVASANPRPENRVAVNAPKGASMHNAAIESWEEF